jgi:hypothetical protein
MIFNNKTEKCRDTHVCLYIYLVLCLNNIYNILKILYYYILLMSIEIVQNFKLENKHLKEKIIELEKELDEVKNKLNTYQSNSKKYYENNKEKIIERVKEYNKNNNYKPIVSSEKKKEYNKKAYLKRKDKTNENI